MKFTPVLVVVALIFTGFFAKYLYGKPSVGKGAPAPELAGELPMGEHFQLSDLRGNYVLLDFWASWCKPCIEESPALRNIYLRYHNASFSDAKNFEIVGVSLDRNRESWLASIAQNQLEWKYQISDLKDMASPLAKLYGVRVIPMKFLLNPAGEIIAVDPAMTEIQKILDEKRK